MLRGLGPADLLSAVLSLGTARIADEETGGLVYADFADWLWHTQQIASIESFDLWLLTVAPTDAAPEQIERARLAATGGGFGG